VKKYLYLTRPEWAATWVNGGAIPIQLASTYLSDSRSGTNTPDETLVHRSSYDITKFRQFGIGAQEVRGLTMRNNTYNGMPMPDVYDADFYHDDGIILSFSDELSSDIRDRLHKQACVEILDIRKLKRIIDKQLGVTGVAGACEYTRDHQRDHFLKSIDDAWQREYRLFWPILARVTVTIPAGLARSVQVE